MKNAFDSNANLIFKNIREIEKNVKDKKYMFMFH